jgi:hypothetical protein
LRAPRYTVIAATALALRYGLARLFGLTPATQAA